MFMLESYCTTLNKAYSMAATPKEHYSSWQEFLLSSIHCKNNHNPYETVSVMSTSRSGDACLTLILLSSCATSYALQSSSENPGNRQQNMVKPNHVTDLGQVNLPD